MRITCYKRNILLVFIPYDFATDWALEFGFTFKMSVIYVSNMYQTCPTLIGNSNVSDSVNSL